MYGDPVVGPRWKELMEGNDNRFSSGIPKDNKRLERSDNKPHSEEQAAMETRKRRRDAAEHFAKNFSILDALRSNLPEVFAAEILPKFDLLSTLSLAQVNKKYRDEVWSVNGVSSLEPKIKAHSYMLMERAKKNGGMHGGETYWNTKPMYWAVKHGNVPAVRALLASGVDVDRSLFKEYIRVFYVWDDFGPLHLAAAEGWLPVVKALIQAGDKGVVVLPQFFYFYLFSEVVCQNKIAGLEARGGSRRVRLLGSHERKFVALEVEGRECRLQSDG